MYSGPQNIPVDDGPRTIDMETFSDQEPASGADFIFFNYATTTTGTFTYTEPLSISGENTIKGNINFIGAVSEANILVKSFEFLLVEEHKYMPMPVDLQGSNRVSSVTETANSYFDDYGVINYHINVHSTGTSSQSLANGNFLGNRGYIGVRFEIEPKTHYGWIQFESTPNGSASTIIDWAYESVPDTPIHIPEPAAIPTLNEWGILILAALILAEGGRRIRKKKDAC